MNLDSQHTKSSPSLAGELHKGTWKVDPARSRVGFSVRHMMVSTLNGCFQRFEGAIEVGASGNVTSASGSVLADSIDTDHPERDTHLRGDEFFDVESFPRITLVTTEVELRSPSEILIVGDLTMRDITRSIRFNGKLQQIDSVEPEIALTLRSEINRRDFGLTWNQVIETGGVAVSDKVKIKLDLILSRET